MAHSCYSACTGGAVVSMRDQVRQAVLDSSLYDDDAMPYIFGEEATDEQRAAENRLTEWLIERASQVASDAVDDAEEAAAAREAQYREALEKAAHDLWQSTRMVERMALDGSETTVSDATSWYPKAFKTYDEIQSALATPPSKDAERYAVAIDAAREVAEDAPDGTSEWHVGRRERLAQLRDALRALDGDDAPTPAQE